MHETYKFFIISFIKIYNSSVRVCACTVNKEGQKAISSLHRLKLCSFKPDCIMRRYFGFKRDLNLYLSLFI